MRPGEIFALTWCRLTATYAHIRQRVYRGLIDTPKNYQSMRQAALSEGLVAEIEKASDGAGNGRRGLGIPFGADDAPVKRQLLAAIDATEACEGGSRMGEFPGDASDTCNLDESFGRGWEAGRRSARP